MDVKLRKSSKLRAIWTLCPARHIIALVCLALTGLYFALRNSRALMVFLSEKAVQPYHRAMASLLGVFRHSVAEFLYCALAVGVVVYIIYQIIQLIRRDEKLRRLYRTVITLLSVFLLVYVGFCLLWGVYYYGESFSEKLGIEAEPVSVEQLETVTRYFADMANEYCGEVERDADGLFAVSRESILDRSAVLYRNIAAEFPCLDGAELRPKELRLSRIISYVNFTGFFFPFTGEANLNMDSPACMLPVTAAGTFAVLGLRSMRRGR